MGRACAKRKLGEAKKICFEKFLILIPKMKPPDLKNRYFFLWRILNSAALPGLTARPFLFNILTNYLAGA